MSGRSAQLRIALRRPRSSEREEDEMLMKRTRADAGLAVLAVPLAAVLLTVSPAVSQRFRASVHLVTVTATVKDSQGTRMGYFSRD